MFNKYLKECGVEIDYIETNKHYAFFIGDEEYHLYYQITKRTDNTFYVLTKGDVGETIYIGDSRTRLEEKLNEIIRENK